MSNYINKRTLDVVRSYEVLEDYANYRLDMEGYLSYNEWKEVNYVLYKDYCIEQSYLVLYNLGLDGHQSLLWVRSYNTGVGAVPDDLFHTEEGAERVLKYLLEIESGESK